VIHYGAGSDRRANQDAAFSRAAVLHWLCCPVSGGRRREPGQVPRVAGPWVLCRLPWKYETVAFTFPQKLQLIPVAGCFSLKWDPEHCMTEV